MLEKLKQLFVKPQDTMSVNTDVLPEYEDGYFQCQCGVRHSIKSNAGKDHAYKYYFSQGEEEIEEEEAFEQDPGADSAAGGESVTLEVEEEDTQELPEFQGIQVVEILGGRHTKTHFHCKMEGGVTMHVPKHLFSE